MFCNHLRSSGISVSKSKWGTVRKCPPGFVFAILTHPKSLDGVLGGSELFKLNQLIFLFQ